MQMEYILFDDCYMHNIEVAYELRNATDYLIASTSEIMIYGMPYDRMTKYLLGNPDYGKVCEEFNSFYTAYTTPCGTIGVSKMSEMEDMVSLMKQINQSCTFDTSKRNTIQDLDGYTETIFYDFGDYGNKLTCNSCNCSSGNSHCRNTEITEDKNRIKLLYWYTNHYPEKCNNWR